MHIRFLNIVLELVGAAVVGILMHDETLAPINIFGIILVIISIILLEFRIRIGYRKRFGKFIPQKVWTLFDLVKQHHEKSDSK